MNYTFLDARLQGRMRPENKLTRSNKDLEANNKCVRIYILSTHSNDIATNAIF